VAELKIELREPNLLSEYTESAFRYSCTIDFTEHCVTWKSADRPTCRAN